MPLWKMSSLVRRNTPHDKEILGLIQRQSPNCHLLFAQTFADKQGEFGNAVVPLRVIVTHLGVEKGVRRQQAQTLVSAINRHINLDTEATVFMGDFNEWTPANAFVRRMDRRFSKHVTRRTFPSYAPLLPLDRIWMSSHLSGIRTVAHRSLLARRASDHLPLCLEV